VKKTSRTICTAGQIGSKNQKNAEIYREVWNFFPCVLIIGFSFICFEVLLMNGLK
jgi:hypothetical protein